MDIQNKEKIFEQVNFMAKFTGEPAVNREQFFSFLDEPQKSYRAGKMASQVSNVVTDKISELIGAELDSLEPSTLLPNSAEFSRNMLGPTAALRNATDNFRIFDAFEKVQSMKAEKANNERHIAPEKTQTLAKAAGPSL